MRTFVFSEFLFILEAAKWTVALSMIAFIGGAIGGLLIALSRTSESRVGQLLAGGFIRFFQGTPLLLQLFLVFFGAPVLGMDINPWVAAGVALILNSSAFLGEINHNRREELLQKIKREIGRKQANVQLFPICDKDVRLRQMVVVNESNERTDKPDGE